MELYIPPPSAFLPRLPPPRPVVPAVPIVPVPDLPDTVHAPEGGYSQNASLFPHIGSPVPPLPFENRPIPTASFMGSAGGFIVAPPGPPSAAQTGQTAMSFGSTVVNGQTQPPWPVKMSFVNVYFPPKAGEKAGLGGLLGMGGKETAPALTSPPIAPTYEPSESSDDSSPTGSDMPPAPIAFEVPLSALPQQQGKRMPFSKTSVASGLPRPKNNLRSSSSTFVTRLQALDQLPKIMAERGKNGGEYVRWGFWNLGRTFGWGEEGGRVKDALARVTFSQVPTCHAISQHTAGPDRVDIVVGFSSGDIVWLDFIIGRYTRINKGGLLNNTPVISVNFDPRYPHHFIALFEDSTVLQFNLFAEDPVTTAINTAPMPWATHFENLEVQVEGSTFVNESEDDTESKVERLSVWKNEEFGNLGDVRNKKEERPTWAGRNPMAAYKIGKKTLTAMAYAPDASRLAAVGEDGMLRLMDVAEEKLTDTFAGYFGALNCVAWSPDSRFVAVGGEDDLITIFSARESRVVARCQGHSAFVTAITFDHGRGGGYRFGSVGEDGKLILWDFTAAQLHRPRHHHANSSHHRLATVGSSLSLNHQNSNTGDDGRAKYHDAPSRNDVAFLQPVMARVIEGNLVTAVNFTSQAIYTVSRAALVKIWQRPPRQKSLARKTQKGSVKNEALKSPREKDLAVVA